MVTWLPYASFQKSAEVLDTALLRYIGKEVAEGSHLICLTTTVESTSHTFAMWRFHPHALAWYGVVVCDEYLRRMVATGKDVLGVAELREQIARYIAPTGVAVVMPPWIGNPEFHASHRSALLRCNPTWYSKFKWREPVNLPLVWPVHTKDGWKYEQEVRV